VHCGFSSCTPQSHLHPFLSHLPTGNTAVQTQNLTQENLPMCSRSRSGLHITENLFPTHSSVSGYVQNQEQYYGYTWLVQLKTSCYLCVYTNLCQLFLRTAIGSFFNMSSTKRLFSLRILSYMCTNDVPSFYSMSTYFTLLVSIGATSIETSVFIGSFFFHSDHFRRHSTLAGWIHTCCTKDFAFT